MVVEPAKRPEVKAFDDAIRRRTGKAASARNWFGYAAVQTLAGSPIRRKPWMRLSWRGPCRDTRCRPTSRSVADRAYFRDRDHQLISPILVGEVHPPRGDRSTSSRRAHRQAGDQAAEPAEASACRLAFPS